MLKYQFQLKQLLIILQEGCPLSAQKRKKDSKLLLTPVPVIPPNDRVVIVELQRLDIVAEKVVAEENGFTGVWQKELNLYAALSYLRYFQQFSGCEEM